MTYNKNFIDFELKFYKKLDKEKLEIAFSNNYSRDDKRAIAKKKTLEDKIRYILQNKLIHIKFIENLLQEYSKSSTMDMDITFDKLKVIYQDDKNIALLIYFYKCIENETWINKEQLTELTDGVIPSKEDGQPEKEYTLIIQNETEEDKMEKTERYLGFISIKNYFYNFSPRFEWKDNNWDYIENYSELFPLKGNVNIYIENKNLLSDLVNGKWYIIEFKVSEFEENVSTNYNTGETTIRDTQSKWKFNEDRIVFDITEKNIFKVAQAKDLDFSKKIIDIYGDEHMSFSDGEKVFLNNEDRYYGPFTVAHRERYGDVEFSYYVKNVLADKYYNKYYTEEDFYFHKDINNFYAIAQIKNIESKFEDTITDEILLEKFSEAVKNLNIFDDIEKSLNKFEQSVFNKDLPIEIQDNRKSHIENILKTFQAEDIYSNQFQTIITNILLRSMNSEDSKFMEWVEKYILGNDDLNTKMQNLRITRKKLGDLQDEYIRITEEQENGILSFNTDIKLKKEELEKLNKQINETKVKNAEELSNEYKENLEILKKQISEKEIQLRNLETKIGAIIDYNDIVKKAKEEQNNYDKWAVDASNKEKEIVRLNKEIEDKQGKLKSQKAEAIKSAIDSVKNNPEKIAFDSMLSNKLVEAAATWDKENGEDKYNKIVEFNNSIELAKEKDIKSYIIQKVKQQRPSYSDYDILNILICISQGFLTIFSGEPGSGKTSICNIIADTLGLTKLKEKAIKQNKIDNLKGYDVNRYISISVERGWTSKRDFLGYYNPLTKTFDKSNRTMYDALKIMILEHEDDKNVIMPYLILLDEANLSPMEYYWGDFMKCFDDTDPNNMIINLGEDYQFKIYDNLRFVATINNDHTTEELSPRLLDRAWVITLPKYNRFAEIKNNFSSSEEKSLDNIGNISWEQFKNLFKISNGVLATETNNILKSLDEIFSSMSISISHRVWDDIENYIKIARGIFEVSEEDKAIDKSEIMALDNAVAQRLLPKINCGIEFEDAFKKLKEQCTEKNGLKKCAEILQKIEKKATINHYYSFFY